MALRKVSKPTKATSPPAASKLVRAATVSASPVVPGEKQSPLPLSWKDAVQRAPAQPPQAESAPPKPVITPAKAKESTTSQPTTADKGPHTKLAARSRSVSRIMQSSSFKKHGDLFPTPTVEGGAKDNSTSGGSHTMMAHSTPSKSSVTKQVSFSTAEGKQTGAPGKKTRTDSDSQRFAELVTRLGLNDAQLMLAQSFGAKKTVQPGGRPRAASADEVLLRRSSPPLWVLADSPATLEDLRYRDLSQWSRKHRAMSVPNAAASGSIHALAKKKSQQPGDDGSERIFQSTPPRRQPSEEDSSELDCEDTRSESTSDSSCMSPRHAPVTQFDQHSPASLDASDRASVDEVDDFSDYMTPEDEEEDYEAYMLLDRISHLSAEFKAHRKYEESSALAWSVQHAARQGAISPQLQQNLLSNIRNGAWEEARDVLYHKCHLVPAVGSLPEPATSSPADPAIEASFERCIDELAPTDGSEARLQKLRVLKILSDLLTTWVKLVGYERGLAEEHIALTSGSLFLAGSYRLGLNDPLSDIDAVCVVPWHVTHDDFFSSFCAMLEQTSGVTHLAPVPNAYVPLISLSFMDVSMDLLFARLPMTGVEPHQEIDSDHILVNVDPTSMKSLNAPRVSSMLLCLVPRRRVFRIVLRAVRAWARRRGIYSSKLGYLGGISWSIVVAFVCQMYPEAEPSKLFVRFFQVFSEWQWPRPVMLNMVYDAGLGFEMWDPRQNLYDRSHIMPIVTPAYPHMNSAVQVSQSTFSVIYEEIWRARYLAEAADGISRSISAVAVASGADLASPVQASEPMATTLSAGVATALRVDTSAATSVAATNAATAAVSGSQFEWSKLFQRSNFFIRYDSYLVVDFQAETSASMHVWGKFVQSRLRKLVDSLQHLSSVSRVHAFPLYFPNTSAGHSPGSCMFIGVEFHSRSRSSSDVHGGSAKEDPEVKANLERTIRFFLATDLQQLAERKQDMVAEARLLSWGELPEFVFEHGRPAAMVERAEYHEDMERMMMQSQGVHYRSPGGHYNGGDRYGNGNGKWRSPNGGQRSGGGGRYFGKGGGKQPRNGGGGDRYRDGGQKSYYIAQGG